MGSGVVLEFVRNLFGFGVGWGDEQKDICRERGERVWRVEDDFGAV